MSASKQTDNAKLDEKLDLRRHFLDKFHKGQRFSVFDCCQGSGEIWSRLRTSYDCQYWGVDLKSKKGRLKIDSVRILQQDGFSADVVDVDTYGSPWKHLLAVIPNIKKPTTLFLTCGMVAMGGGGNVPNVPNVVQEACGFKFSRKVPVSLLGKLRHWFDAYMLSLPNARGLSVEYCAKTPGTKTAQYYGIHIKPR